MSSSSDESMCGQFFQHEHAACEWRQFQSWVQIDHSAHDVVMFLDASEIKQTMFFLAQQLKKNNQSVSRASNKTKTPWPTATQTLPPSTPRGQKARGHQHLVNLGGRQKNMQLPSLLNTPTNRTTSWTTLLSRPLAAIGGKTWLSRWPGTTITSSFPETTCRRPRQRRPQNELSYRRDRALGTLSVCWAVSGVFCEKRTLLIDVNDWDCDDIFIVGFVWRPECVPHHQSNFAFLQRRFGFGADPRHAREVIDEPELSTSKPVSSPFLVAGTSRCHDGELKFFGEKKTNVSMNWQNLINWRTIGLTYLLSYERNEASPPNFVDMHAAKRVWRFDRVVRGFAVSDLTFCQFTNGRVATFGGGAATAGRRSSKTPRCDVGRASCFQLSFQTHSVWGSKESWKISAAIAAIPSLRTTNASLITYDVGVSMSCRNALDTGA